jgi:hypothetical protein
MRELVAAKPSVGAPAPRVTPISIGLVAIIVAFIGMGSLHALQQPPFFAPDETAHVGYAQEVASGRLPEITRFPEVPDAATQWEAERGNAMTSAHLGVWVANHPPLFYVAVAPLIWLSRALDQADGGLLFLRLANVGFAAVGIAFTYLLALEISRRDRRLALFAAALVALVPQGHAVFSQGLNDGLGFAAGTAVVWAGVRCLRRRGDLTGSDLVILGATAAVAFGARAATMLLAVAVVGVVALHRATRPSGDPRARVGRVGRVLVAGLAPGVVLFGWFYLRNVVLYGDPGASEYLLRLFRREERGSVLEMMNRRYLWLRLYESLMSPTTRARITPPVSFVLTGLSIVGVGIAVVTGRLGRDAEPSDDAPARAELRWTLGLCLLSLGVVAFTIAQHVSGGGNAHARYAMPAIGAAAVLVVVGAERMWSRWGPVVVVGVAGWWALLNLPVDVNPLISRGRRDRFGLPPEPLRVLPLSDGWRTLAGALIVVGVTVAGVVLLATLRSTDHASPEVIGLDESGPSPTGGPTDDGRGARLDDQPSTRSA